MSAVQIAGCSGAGKSAVAAGAMRAMREAGRAVPQDVSIIGFDDTEVSGYLTPSRQCGRVRRPSNVV
jgi:DNA-binding LacI/PurR family transcriptional regulator